MMISSIIILVLLGPLPALQGSQHYKTAVLAGCNELVRDSYRYYTYQTMIDLLQNLQKNYSDIMSVVSIGKTCQGRDIWMVKISDHVDTEEDEPGVLLMGA